MRIVTLLGILGLSSLGCGDGGGAKHRETADCADQDGDGYGEGEGCLGPDCNDGDETLRTDEECAAWCDAHQSAPGCPCNSLEPVICYGADEATRGVGPCRAGLATCGSVGGELVWSECDGQVVPEPESCDGEDDDCDGEIDEGTLSECGTCGACHVDCTGALESCDPWDSGDPDGAIVTAEGNLELPIVDRERHVLWPYSANTGMVLRVDTETFAVEGSFRSGPNGAGGLVFGDAPAASAVDSEGNVLVANRAPLFGLPSITKIAADPESCPDADGDGTVETSAAWDDALAFPTDDSWEDECILFHVAFDAGAAPAGLAIQETIELDGSETEVVWVGLYGRGKFVELDATTGDATGVEAPTPGMGPEGAALDADGWVWTKSLIGGLFFGAAVGRFDTASPDDSFEIVPIGGRLPVAIAIDEEGAPWVAAVDGLYRWDVGAALFDVVPLAAADGTPVAPLGVAADGAGSVWVGAGAAGVYRVDLDDLDAVSIATPGTDAQAMATDFDGHAWAFGQTTGNATVVDLEDEGTDVVLDDCGGAPCLDTPQISGDVAGLQSWSERMPTATWTKDVLGCDIGEPTWRTLEIDAAVPAETRVEAGIRMGATPESLVDAPLVSLGTVDDGGATLDVAAALAAARAEPGLYARIEVALSSLGADATPTLRHVSLVWGCPDVFQ